MLTTIPQQIVISASGNNGVLLLNKLFELRFKPENILVINYKQDDTVFKSFCETYCIPYYVIANDQELNQFVKDNKVELLINISGLPYLVSQDTLNNIKTAAVNLHTALVEEYRGRWMVSWALINGNKYCGYTWHHINSKFDSGNIILQNKFLIGSTDTALSLNNQIINHAICNLEYVIEHSKLPGKVPEQLGQYYNKSMPFNGEIQEHWTDEQVDRFIRAMYYPPYTGATYKGQAINTIEQLQKLKISNNENKINHS